MRSNSYACLGMCHSIVVISLTHSLTHLPTHSLTHSLTCAGARSRSRSSGSLPQGDRGAFGTTKDSSLPKEEDFWTWMRDSVLGAFRGFDKTVGGVATVFATLQRYV